MKVKTLSKFFVTGLLLSCFSFSAKAEVIVCANSTRDVEYLLALDANIGKAFVKMLSIRPTFQALPGEAVVKRSINNGPISVRVEREAQIDWSREPQCFKRLGDGYQFNIANANGSLLIFPVFIIKPDSNCQIPRGITRPMTLTCKLL